MATYTKIIPPAYRSRWHTVFDSRYNPYIAIKTRIAGDGNNPANNLPVDLAGGAFIRPVIRAIDKRIAESGFPQIMESLNLQLTDVKDRLESSQITPEDASKESLRIVQDFMTDNKTQLSNLSQNLSPIIRELQFERDIALLTEKSRQNLLPESEDIKNPKPGTLQFEVGRAIANFERDTGATVDKDAVTHGVRQGGKALFFLESTQADAMLSYASHLREICVKLSDPAHNFQNNYEQRIKDSISKSLSNSDIAKVIVEDVHQPLHMGRTALMRIEDDDKKNWKDIVPAIPLIPLPVLNKFTLRSIPGIKQEKRKYKLEDTDALFRQFDIGYYNPSKRTMPVTRSPNQPNTERFDIQIESFDASKSNAAALAELIIKGYNFGEEWETLYALRQLRRKTGRGGDTVPQDLIAQIDPNPKRPPDGGAHYDGFSKAVKSIASAIEHSPVLYGQRHVMQMYTNWTFWPRYARRFVGTGQIATPFKDKFWITPKNKLIQEKLAGILGAKALHETNAEGNPVVKRQWFDPLPDKPTLMGRVKHFVMGVPKILGRSAWHIVTLPFYPGALATSWIIKNKTFQSAALATTILGGVAMVIEEGYEKLENQGKPLTVLGIHVDLGSRALGGVLKATDLALAPARWNAGLLTWGFSTTTGIDTTIFGKDLAAWASTKPLMDFNVAYLGDRGDAVSTEPPPKQDPQPQDCETLAHDPAAQLACYGQQVNDAAKAPAPGNKPEQTTPQAPAAENCETITDATQQLQCYGRRANEAAKQTSFIPVTPTAGAFARVAHSQAHVNIAFNGVSISKAQAAQLNRWRIYNDDARRHASPETEIA